MGQMTIGVMLGSEVPDSMPARVTWYGDEEDEITLIDTFKVGRGPDVAMSECGEIVGFWIAVGPHGDSGFPAIAAAPVSLDKMAITKPYAKHYDRAVKAWERFDRHCHGHGVTLANPRLFLARTEIA